MSIHCFGRVFYNCPTMKRFFPKSIFWSSRKLVGIRLSDNSCPVSKNCLYQSVWNPAPSSVGSCTKFYRILHQVLRNFVPSSASRLHYSSQKDSCWNITPLKFQWKQLSSVSIRSGYFLPVIGRVDSPPPCRWMKMFYLQMRNRTFLGLVRTVALTFWGISHPYLSPLKRFVHRGSSDKGESMRDKMQFLCLKGKYTEVSGITSGNNGNTSPNLCR